MSYEIPIERGKIREFAIATKSENPAYDRPDAVSPPTFLTTARNFWEPPNEVEVTCIRQTGGVAISGTAAFHLPG